MMKEMKQQERTKFLLQEESNNQLDSVNKNCIKTKS